MRQANLNVHASMMQNGQSIKRSQNLSKNATSEFDKVFADKFSENSSLKTSKNRQLTNKSMKQSTGNEIGDKEDHSITDEEPKNKAVKPEKDRQLECEILTIIQSMEEIIQQINGLNALNGELDHDDFQSMMRGLQVQLGELLSQVEQFSLSNQVLQGNKVLDMNMVQGVALETMDTLADMIQFRSANIQSGEIETILTKLQGAMGEQLEILHNLSNNSIGEQQKNPLSNLQPSIETNQGKNLDHQENKGTTFEKSQMTGKMIFDETGEEAQENLDQGSEKQDGFFSAMKVNVGNTALQQVEPQVFELDQVNIVEQTKPEAPTSQTVKSNNVIEQVTNKFMVNLGDKGSEMILQLKPEHLGKLTMKISIERGIVVASFVAESQTVKEVIESNFNVLKDALNEKGLGVQELSVFVGSDSNFQGRNNFMAFQRKVNKGNNSYNDAAYGNAVEQASPVGPRALNTSKLDFFA